MFGAEGFELWWLFPLLLIVLCFIMMRGCSCCAGGDRDRGDRSGSALEILNKRYARGEIDTREYERQKKNLTQRAE